MFLFKFGPKSGDTFLDKDLSQCSTSHNLPDNFQFGGTNHSKLFVCAFGALAFDRKIYVGSEFNTSYIENENHAMIAPFYSDVSLRDNFLDTMCVNSTYEDPLTNDSYEPEKICSFFSNSTDAETLDFIFYFNEVLDPQLREDLAYHSREMGKVLKSQLNSTAYDDYISRKVFGLGSTEDVNLANNVYMREMTASDINIANGFFSNKSVDVQIDWGFVATWYKVTSFPGRLDAYNSFQASIACSPSTGSLQRCFSIFDFGELQWTISPFSDNQAISGFNGGNGKKLFLLFSKTPAIRNLWAFSNVGIDGVWVYEFNETDSDPVTELGPVPLDLIELEAVCNGPLEPSIFESGIATLFRITDCDLPPNQAYYGFRFQSIAATGDSPVQAFYYPENRTLIAYGSYHYYGVGPEVVNILVNDLTLIGEKYVFAYIKANNGGLLKANYTSGQNEVYLSLDNCSSIGSFENLTVTFPGGITDTQKLNMGELSYTYSLNTSVNTTHYVVQFSIEGKCESLPIFVHRPSSLVSSNDCMNFANSERLNNYTNCISMLERWYPCPRKPQNLDTSNLGPSPPSSDADWAILEVTTGISRWEYDICCDNGTNPDRRDQLFRSGYCRKDRCEFKSRRRTDISPAFCIRSPRLACSAEIDAVVKNIMVSNQCCYSTNRSLFMNQIDPYYAYQSGSMQIEVNSMSNLVAHFESELDPFGQCCLFGSPMDCNNTFKKHRPSAVGNYWPRNIILNRGDPHLSTIDGHFYPFMGIGVYTMLITLQDSSSDDATEFQASMRQLGAGTVFSGIAIRHKLTLVECYLSRITKELKVSVNRVIKTVGQGLSEYTLANVVVRESVTNDGIQMIRFNFQQNMMIVEVYNVGNLINLRLSVPPSFKNKTRGLMGTYDGNIENDFTASDGSVVNITADLQEVHDVFGESWKVPDQRDWLFSTEEFVNAIQQEIEDDFGFIPKYEITFTDEAFRNQTNITCKGDPACIRDVSLVGDLSIATAFTAFQQDIQTAQLWNEVARLNDDNFYNPVPSLVPNPGEIEIEEILDLEEKDAELLIIIMGSTFAFIILLFFIAIICKSCKRSPTSGKITTRRTPKVEPVNFGNYYDETAFNDAFGYVPKLDRETFDNIYSSQLKW